jgi:hypothetical protein
MRLGPSLPRHLGPSFLPPHVGLYKSVHSVYTKAVFDSHSRVSEELGVFFRWGSDPYVHWVQEASGHSSQDYWDYEFS